MKKIYNEKYAKSTTSARTGISGSGKNEKGAKPKKWKVFDRIEDAGMSFLKFQMHERVEKGFFLFAKLFSTFHLLMLDLKYYKPILK